MIVCLWNPNAHRCGASTVLGLVAWLSSAPFAGAQPLTVVSVDPPRHALTAPVDSAITIEFDRPVDRASILTGSSFWAFGRWSGTVAGAYSFSNGDATVTLAPYQPFSAGETVMVILSHDIIAADSTPLRAAGYSYQFWTAAREATMVFTQLDQMSTRDGPSRTTAYGGIASDLNGDRFLDITIVNEDTADLRVFLNRADGSGLFNDFLRPTFPVNDRASPSEPADFNRDGHVDICVANINTNSVSVLLGIGNGQFGAHQEIAVGAAPRGIAVLDVDGDGDVDIVNTNANANGFAGNMSVLLNDGTGVFGAATFFEGGGTREWALAAADMNDDGILDLAIGARSSQQVLIQTGNGDGTFTLASSQGAGGGSWMLVCGDVNGDGTEDVAVVNASQGNGAILLGDGAGQLAAPMTRPTDPFPIAVDLGDLDGDGDLDWVTSSFSGNWFLFQNDGAGVMSFQQELPATGASSCSLLFDADNDGDLDLALIDEIDDVITTMANNDPIPIPAVSAGGSAALVLLLCVAGVFVIRRRNALTA